PEKDYHYWRFNEAGGTTAADSSDYAAGSGATFTATLSNGASFADNLGILGNALAFGGGGAGSAGPYAEIDGNPLADCGKANQFTIAAWIQIKSYATNS